MKNGRGTEALETRDHFKATYGELLLAHLHTPNWENLSSQDRLKRAKIG